MKSALPGSIIVLWLLSAPLAALGEKISGQVVSVLDGDTIEVLHKRHAERIRLHGIDCPVMVRPSVSERSKLLLNWFSGKMYTFTLMAKINISVHLLMYSYRMEPTSIRNWSKKAGAGGIGNMRRRMSFWKNWSDGLGRQA